MRREEKVGGIYLRYLASHILPDFRLSAGFSVALQWGGRKGKKKKGCALRRRFVVRFPGWL